MFVLMRANISRSFGDKAAGPSDDGPEKLWKLRDMHVDSRSAKFEADVDGADQGPVVEQSFKYKRAKR